MMVAGIERFNWYCLTSSTVATLLGDLLWRGTKPILRHPSHPPHAAVRCSHYTAGIDEMPNSQIEKRNMESISPIFKREMPRSVFCFKKKTRIFGNLFVRNLQSFVLFWEEKSKFCKPISWFERRSQRRDLRIFVTRKRSLTTRNQRRKKRLK